MKLWSRTLISMFKGQQGVLRLTWQQQRFFSMGSSFKNKAAGAAKLKQFFKYTHPDFFGDSPENVKETNLRSVQELNEYLTNVGNPMYNSGCDARTLTFYVKPEEKGAKNYKRFTIELLPLKPQQTPETKTMHYSK